MELAISRGQHQLIAAILPYLNDDRSSFNLLLSINTTALPCMLHLSAS